MENFISKSWLTIICLIVIAIWGLRADKKFKASVDKDPFGDYQQPQTASILGVLGTFFGISIGLLNFNPAQEAIQQSVINLLSGMTTAFFTSIVGMGISLYFKNYQANAQKNFHGVKNDATIADLIKYLQKSDEQKLNRLKELLAGDENTNVVRELKHFGETLAENNTKAFIETLENSIKDFNQKMSEQFGENFKQFNIAVERLLQWQENYKTTVEIVTENLQATVEGIGVVKSSLEQIEKSAAAMTESSEQIQNFIVTANFYSRKLQEVLREVQTLGEISKSAVSNIIALVQNSCDEIQSYTELATQDVTTHVNSVASNLESQMSSATKNSEEMTRQIILLGNNSLEKIIEVTEKNLSLLQNVSNKYAAEIQSYTELATQTVNSHVNSVASNLENQTINILLSTMHNIKSMQKMSEELRNESYKIISATNEKMNQLMTTNDANLKKSLETLGRAMLKISDKFVEDYTPLVNELRKIVEISKQVRGGR